MSLQIHLVPWEQEDVDAEYVAVETSTYAN